MPARAVGAQLSRLASKNVLAMCDRLEMSRVHASVISAEVIQFRAWVSDEQVVGQPVRQDGLVRTHADSPIASAVLGARPDPARTKLGSMLRDRTVEVDLRPESRESC
jgi:hypothetical protein